MKRALLMVLLALPLAAEDFDSKRTTISSDFRFPDFQAVYRQLLSGEPPSGIYAFALDPDSLQFLRAERSFIAAISLRPVHDGEVRAPNQSFFPVREEGIHAWGIRVHNQPAGQKVGVVFPGEFSLREEERLRYLVVVRIDPEGAPRPMKSADPALATATGVGPLRIEHVIRARILEIWAYDVRTGKVLGKQDWSQRLH